MANSHRTQAVSPISSPLILPSSAYDSLPSPSYFRRSSSSSASFSPAFSAGASPPLTAGHGGGGDPLKLDADNLVLEEEQDAENGQRQLDEEGKGEGEGEGEGEDYEFTDGEDDMHAEGIPRAYVKLDVRRSDLPTFPRAVLDLLSKHLSIPGWATSEAHPSSLPLDPQYVLLHRVSGSFTNAVFFVSYRPPGKASNLRVPPTVLLRVYGTDSATLISRRTELLILHTLSSLYDIGPRILGTFSNGRVEQYFDCVPIGKEGMRDLKDPRVHDGGAAARARGERREGYAQWVARRMRELHEVPLDVVARVLESGDLRSQHELSDSKGFGRGIAKDLLASGHARKTKTSRRPPLLHHQSPAPMTDREERESPAQPLAVDFATQRGSRSSAVSSFDSLATSYSSASSVDSVSSFDSATTVGTPAFGPTSVPAEREPFVSNLASSSQARSSSRGRAVYSPVLLPSTESSAEGASQLLRSVDKNGSAGRKGRGNGHLTGPYPGVWRRIKRWSKEAEKVLRLVDGAKVSLPSQRSRISKAQRELDAYLSQIEALNFSRLKKEVEAYKAYVRRWERAEGQSRRVFSHNDSQYGNLLRIKDENAVPPSPRLGPVGSLSPVVGPIGKAGRSRGRPPPEHHALVVIDFEYASPNPRGYDIANHFHEWRTDYHHRTLSWSLRSHGAYPNERERRIWLRAYVEQGKEMLGTVISPGALLASATRDSRPLGQGAAVETRPGLESRRRSHEEARPHSDNGAAHSAPAPESRVNHQQEPSPVQHLRQPSGGLASSSSGEATPHGQITPTAISPRSPKRPSVAVDAASGDTDASGTGTQRAIGPLSSSPSKSKSAGATPTLAAASSSSSSSSDADMKEQTLHKVGSSSSLRSTSSTGSASFPPPSADPVALAHLATRIERSMEAEVDRLEAEVRVWSPASHAVWGLWGIVFAREEIERRLAAVRAEMQGGDEGAEEEVRGDEAEATEEEGFDNLKYAAGRFDLFREEIEGLNVQVDDAF